ncbi:type IV secretory system conjugative DNA transfer family protein [Asticcacaulis sp.]|uniref:type IV secretory system conjugative DNA transfer family protein n=1 Tax=Asticcacaulis sp. TaxID=1872648 RepID=UPI0039198991
MFDSTLARCAFEGGLLVFVRLPASKGHFFGKAQQTGISYSEHHTGRPLLTPDEVRQMHPDTQLLFLNGQRLIVATRLR